MCPCMAWCMCRTEDIEFAPFTFTQVLWLKLESSDLHGVPTSLTGLLKTHEPPNSLLIVDPFSRKIIIENLQRTVYIREQAFSVISALCM